MIVQVKVLKRIKYGIQCSLSCEAGQAIVNYFFESKKRTLSLQKASASQMELLLAEKGERVRDGLDAAREKWEEGCFPIELDETQALLPGLETKAAPQSSPESERAPGWTLFTDGGASPNPGPGACAWLIQRPDGEREEGARYLESTTNNRMELLGVIEGLGRIPPTARVTVYSDSRYVQQGISSWIINWKRKGWKTATGSAVLNRDLWEQLDALATGRTIRWLWVRGHAGQPENERCDELVGLARRGRRDI